jgi:predicted methyltransferase
MTNKVNDTLDRAGEIFEVCTLEKCERVIKVRKLFDQARAIRDSGDLAAYAEAIADAYIAVDRMNMYGLETEEVLEIREKKEAYYRVLAKGHRERPDLFTDGLLEHLDSAYKAWEYVLINYQRLLDNGFNAQFAVTFSDSCSGQ